jgi:hypothetical protein
LVRIGPPWSALVRLGPPIGQSKARAEGSLIFIAPGETRQYDIQIEILNNQEQINNTIKN